MNATVRPSGDTAGLPHEPAFVTRSRIAPVATSTTRSCDVSYFMSASGRGSALKTIDLLSGVQSMDAALRSSPAPTLHLPFVSWRGGPALSRHDEEVREAVFEKADLILPVVKRLDYPRRRRPFRALRLGGIEIVQVSDRRRTSRTRSTGRRATIARARRFDDVCNLRGRTFDVHPANEELCLSARPRRDTGGACRRATSARRSFDEEAMLRAIRVQRSTAADSHLSSSLLTC